MINFKIHLFFMSCKKKAVNRKHKFATKSQVIRISHIEYSYRQPNIYIEASDNLNKMMLTAPCAGVNPRLLYTTHNNNYNTGVKIFFNAD